MLRLYIGTKKVLVCSGLVPIFFSIALLAALFQNESLFFLLNRLAIWHPRFWLHLTHLGEVFIVISLFCVFIRRHSELLRALAISMVLAVLVVQGIKYVVNAPRPPAILPVDKIHVLVSAFHKPPTHDPTINYEHLIDVRPDTAAAWQNIQSDPNSPEARYWVPRMGGIITKKQFGIAFTHETFEIEQNTYQGIYQPNNRSFPSGHTATIVCALTLVMLHFRIRKWAWGLVLIALAVGCSRIIVGVHWPLDVAVGGLIGWAVAIVGTWLSHRAAITLDSIGHRVIALLPGLAALVLLVRDPMYPDIALFEIIVGVTSLLLAANGFWHLYRKISPPLPS
jgi:membrane-associated phospholipid phosphatase